MENASRDVEFARHYKLQSVLEHARLGRRKDVASRATENSGDDLVAVLTRRRDNNRDVRKPLHHASQSHKVFHSGHVCIEQQKIKNRRLGYVSEHVVDAVGVVTQTLSSDRADTPPIPSAHSRTLPFISRHFRSLGL